MYVYVRVRKQQMSRSSTLVTVNYAINSQNVEFYKSLEELIGQVIGHLKTLTKRYLRQIEATYFLKL